MKSVQYCCILLSFVCLFGCKQQQDAKAKKQTTPTEKTTSTLDSKLLYQSPVFLSDATGRAVRIVADSTSYDQKFGESYRVLKVYKEVNGEERELSSRLLPVNASPDFRYSFADVYATDDQEWVVIQGFYFFFIYDVVNNQLSEKIYPEKPKNFEAADAQSASITSLTFKDKYLTGTAQDIGNFKMSIKQLRKKLSTKK